MKKKPKIKVKSIYPKNISLEEKERALFWCYDIIFTEKEKLKSEKTVCNKN